MRHPQDTIRQPLITEKSTLQKDATGAYCFKVDQRANKIEIARAVEAVFGVKVAEVRTARVRGKWSRLGRFQGKRPNWKKAWVRLAPGEREIELFEST